MSSSKSELTGEIRPRSTAWSDEMSEANEGDSDGSADRGGVGCKGQ